MLSFPSRLAPLAVLLLLCAAGTSSNALTIDFEDPGIVHGTVMAWPMGSFPDYVLRVDNHTKIGFDIAVAFDTSVTGSLDPDLQFDHDPQTPQTGFAGGNIADEDIGNILIIQANDRCDPALCEDPEDEGHRPIAGFLDFRLSLATATGFSIDLVDVDDSTRENGSISFYLLGDGEDPDAGNLVSSASFASFAGSNGVEYGNNTANRLAVGEVGLFNAVVVKMGGSGGIDNLNFENFTQVPEPTTAALVSLGLGTLAFCGRRRRA